MLWAILAVMAIGCFVVSTVVFLVVVAAARSDLLVNQISPDEPLDYIDAPEFQPVFEQRQKIVILDIQYPNFRYPHSDVA